MNFDRYNAYNDDGRLEKEQSFWKAAAEGYDEWIANDFQDQYEVNWNILTKYIDPTCRAGSSMSVADRAMLSNKNDRNQFCFVPQKALY